MRRVVLGLLLIALALLPACSTVRAAAPGGGRLLYHWTFPAKGHLHAWVAQRGVLGYDGNGDAALFPHFTLKNTPNFAVQAQMRGLGFSTVQENLAGFGLVTRTTISDPHTSIAGGSFFTPIGPNGKPTVTEDNNPELRWNGQTVGQAAFDPGTAWHLYRLEVQGHRYTLLIDGVLMVRYTIDDYSAPTHVGIFSTLYRVQVRAFAVYALGPSSTPVAVDPMPRQANLAVGDLPTDGFATPYLEHWSTPEEVARERGVSVDSLLNSGFVTGYSTEFYVLSHQALDIYSTINAFRTSSQAQTEAAARLQHFRATLGDQPGFHSLTGLAVGESSGGFSLDLTPVGVPSTLLVVIFSRGRDVVFVRLVTESNASPAASLTLTTQLAAIIDQRLQTPKLPMPAVATPRFPAVRRSAPA